MTTKLQEFFLEEQHMAKLFRFLQAFVFKREVLILFGILMLYFILRLIAFGFDLKRLLCVLRRISPAIYILFILGITVFNRDTGIRELRITPDTWFHPDGGIREAMAVEAIFNFLFYIPLGWLLFRWLPMKKKLLKSLISLLIIVGTSILTEALQYYFAKGVSSLEDLILNSFGGLLGTFIALLLSHIELRIKDKRHCGY